MVSVRTRMCVQGIEESPADLIRLTTAAILAAVCNERNGFRGQSNLTRALKTATRRS